MVITKNKKILSRYSNPVEDYDYEHYKSMLSKVVDQYKGKIQGCALPQLGISLRGFTIRDPKTKEFSYVFNPKVNWKLGVRTSYEGCLSIPYRYYVLRPLFISVTYDDENDKRVHKILGPKRSRIFMHEFDHLNGVTIDDKGGVMGAPNNA